MSATPTRVRLAAAILICSLGCTPGELPGADHPLPTSAQIPHEVMVPIERSRVTERPAKPLALPVPSPPSPDYLGQDLSKADGDELASLAGRFADDGNPGEAARFQYWAVRAGVAGQYNLACWTALAGDLDGAFYWLQEAALDDGVDESWAGQDPDLDALHKDPRWKEVAPFLKRCNAYWACSGQRQTVLVLPEGYKKGTPIGVLVGLHGLGHRPDGFVDEDEYQSFANELNMAIVGVSGTVATGRRSFIWSGGPPDRRPADPPGPRRGVRPTDRRSPAIITAFGFSQGAQMGFEVAFQNPDEYLGAIVMSPGTTNRFFRLNKLTPSPGNRRQAYVCLCGAEEAPGNVSFTRNDAEFARKAGARVDLKLYEGMDKHTFPPDFTDSLVRWVRFIEGGGDEAGVRSMRPARKEDSKPGNVGPRCSWRALACAVSCLMLAHPASQAQRDHRQPGDMARCSTSAQWPGGRGMSTTC